MDNIDQIIAALKTFGVPGLMSIFLGWIGKRYLEKKLESEKAANQANIKYTLKYSPPHATQVFENPNIEG